MSRRPARETIAFAIALAALAVVGGVAAAGVAGAAPTSGDTTAPTSAETTAPRSADATAPRSADASVSADVTAPNATIDYDGDRLNVDQSSDATISGTSDLHAGEQVTVRVRSSGENPFLRQNVANVSVTGSFETTMDFSNIERGVEFTVTIMHNGTTLAEAPAVVGECDPTCGENTGSVDLETNVVQVTQGDVASIEVSLTDRETATVVVGSEDTNMRLPVTVSDGNGDGTVVLELETAVDDADDAGVSTKSSADRVRVHDDVNRPASMDPSDYDVELYLDGDGRGEKAEDVGTLVVNDATEDLDTTRSTDANGDDETSTTVGTVYESATTELDSSSSGLGFGTMGILAVGGLLAVLGIVALVGGLE